MQYIVLVSIYILLKYKLLVLHFGGVVNKTCRTFLMYGFLQINQKKKNSFELLKSLSTSVYVSSLRLKRGHFEGVFTLANLKNAVAK